MKEKGSKAPAILLMLAAAACILYGAAVLAVIGPARVFNWAFIVIGVCLIALSLLLPALRRLPKGLVRALCALLCAFLAVFAFAEFKIASASASEPLPGADYVIILGAKVETYGPSVEFSARIRAAAAYLKENPGSKAVTTGGKGGDEPESEGRAAADMLQRLGIAPERILTEEKSRTTIENFLFARAAIEEDGGVPGNCSVIIVSSGFHLYRAGLYARACGFEHISYEGSEGLKILLPQYYIREFAALAWDSVTGRFRRAF
jgi:uncharacterized SAM-binding protein YcdF (DUF218 family)